MDTYGSDATVAASNFGTAAQSPNDPSIAIGGVGPGIGMNRKPAIRIAKSVAAPMAAYRTCFEGAETRIAFRPARPDRVPIVPLTRPCSPIRPFTRPVGVTRPLTRPAPFTRPFVRPSPLTRPFSRPRPLTRPLTFPAPRVAVFGRAPLTSPLLPRIHPDRNPTAGGTGEGSAAAFVSSRFSEAAALIVASTPIVSSSSSMSQSRTAAFVSSSSSGVRDCSSSPTRRSSTRMSSSGAPAADRFATGSAGAPASRAPHDGHSATFLGTSEPQLGHVGVVEIQESRIAFGGELLADRLVHLFFVERGAAFETGGRECGGDATAQGTLVLVLRDRFLRPPRRSVLDEMEGREHLARGDRPDLRDSRELVDRCPRDLPERIVPAVDQRLGPRRIEAEDLQQMDEGGRVGLPIDPSLRTARGSRDRLRLHLKVRG